MKKLEKCMAVLFATLIALASFWLARREVDRIWIFSLLQKEARKMDLTTKLEITETVLQLSGEYRLDPKLILAIMKVESQFNPKALSNRDARGLMQVRPIVVREVAKEMGIDPKDHSLLLENHRFNIEVGVHYLANLIKKFKGDIGKALMAYNAGPTTVARLYKNRPVPTGGYQGKVLRIYEGFSGS